MTFGKRLIMRSASTGRVVTGEPRVFALLHEVDSLGGVVCKRSAVIGGDRWSLVWNYGTDLREVYRG